jgi:aminoglycoside phosphotransferase (APT) family kinase protein
MLYRSVELSSDELRARLAPAGVQDIRPLAGGASSLTYAGTIAGGRPVVVKVAPAGVAPVLHRDVLRQSRLLRALAGTGVPVPEVLGEDAGDPPEVPPLFVMSFVEGTSFEPLFDPDPDPDPGGSDGDDAATVADRLRGAARTMAALHALAPEHLGLGGEPVVGPADEVERWCRLLRTVDPALAPGWEDAAAALRAAEPPALPPAVVHGDLRLGNMLAAGPHIRAIIDWEIWTVGDPRVDLGWFLVNADPETYRRPTRYAAAGALPSPAELASVYGDGPDVGWFEALACFKSTATWALIVKHNRRRPEPDRDPDLEAMAGALPHLLDRARAKLRGAGSP